VESRMKALRFYDFGDMRVDEVPLPECGPRDVLMRVRVVQPSVTEAIIGSGRKTIGYERAERRLRSEAPVGLFGHEYCATVVDVGEEVERIQIGDRIVGHSILPCHECALCASGHEHWCRSGPMFGFDMPGALAEYAVCPQDGVVAIPEGLSDYEAAAVQPAAECVASVESAQIQRGDSVAVIGQGAMGIYSMQAVRHTLADQVIAVDVRPEPLESARALGADHCVNAATTDPVAAVRELTGGRGADVVIESAGGPPQEGLAGATTVEQAFEMVRNCGRVVINSLIPGRTGLDFLQWRMRSIALIFPGTANISHLATTALMTVQGRLQIDPLISHAVWGLEHAPLAFEITAGKARYGATGPCQIVVDTHEVPPHHAVIREQIPA
jgi:threonine dehydrogenase-like Zn-dependent dehydrogenase